MSSDTKKISDLTIRTAKPADKPYRIGIGENVYCEVLPSGAKVWRMRFLNPETNKPAIYTFGKFTGDTSSPHHIPLKQVRRLADDAKYLIKQGIHPLRERERLRLAQISSAERQFEVIARQWWQVRRPEWEPKNADKILRGLECDVFPVIGQAPIDQLSAPDLLRMLRKIEKRGAIDYTHRIKQRCSLIFSFAIGEGLAERNPVEDIKANLKKYKGNHHKYLSADQLPAFMIKLETWKNPVVKLAIQLVMHVVLRTNEIRQAKWDEIDFDAALWRAPAENMKMGIEHTIPLSKQAIELLRQLEAYRKGDYLFSLSNKRKPMSSGTMIQCLYDLGYSGVTTVHGFRSTFRTIVADAGWSREHSEAALAHKIIGVEGAYNHSTYLDQRRELMQWYGDYLDALRSGADVIPIKSNKAKIM